MPGKTAISRDIEKIVINKRLCAVLAFAATALASTGNVYATSGNDLHQWLLEQQKFKNGANADGFSIGAGFGYVSGISDKLAGEGDICFPSKNITKGQLVDIVLKMLDANPEVRHLRASAIVTVALQDSFPCKK